MTDFMTLPEADAIRLDGLSVPAACLGREGGLLRTSLTIAGGRIVEDREGAVAVDMKGAMALPAFVDTHTHLDKGHIWPRAANPDGTFMGALSTVGADHANWSAEDTWPRAWTSRCAAASRTGRGRSGRTSIRATDRTRSPGPSSRGRGRGGRGGSTSRPPASLPATALCRTGRSPISPTA